MTGRHINLISWFNPTKTQWKYYTIIWCQLDSIHRLNSIYRLTKVLRLFLSLLWHPQCLSIVHIYFTRSTSNGLQLYFNVLLSSNQMCTIELTSKVALIPKYNAHSCYSSFCVCCIAKGKIDQMNRAWLWLKSGLWLPIDFSWAENVVTRPKWIEATTQILYTISPLNRQQHK